MRVYFVFVFLCLLIVVVLGQDISVLLSRELFNEMLKHRNDAACPANGFYTYDAFVAAANSFSGFGTTGDTDTRKREIAAFMAQTSHETTGGWPTAPDGPYSWGYCFKEEQGNPPDYCVANQEWPCVTEKKYYGRGPIQISYNYNYGPAGKAINSDLLGNPDLVATDPTISFKTALWFWMTPQSPKPSCHDVITGRWAPSTADSSAGRVPGYGVITNIINGGIECGKGQNAKVEDRIGFYKRYCDLLQVGYGKNLDCYGQDISVLLSRELFNEMLKHRNDAACPANGFYTYDAFVAAANSFSGFGTTGDTDTRKREIAAFLAQTSHETTGGWPTAPDGPYSWGYCFKEEQGNPPDYCVANQEWPCVTGKKYYGRGPIQISYNYNYGPAGKAINSDLLGNPDLVATDPTISFKTALWFWMTPQSPKPSCHDVITGRWAPSTADSSAGRVPGYGVITNIINGGIECGKGQNAKVEDRIGFYKRYCDLLQVGYGKNLDCYGQDISVLLSRELFNEMLKHRNDAACPANGFYTYDAFVAAANSFSGFGTTGDTDTRKREIAAFLAQTSHEITGGWPTAPDGPYSWGYCFKEEQGNPPDYCVANQEWPCVTGKKYYGRGPIQISYNYNYGPAGKAINSDLLGNPDLVATDPTISFKTALWFWMTPQSPKPSCHDVITGRWAPSTADSSAGRVPGYGVITNIINGGIECGKGQNAKVEDRIGFYKRYCDLLQVGYGKNLDCYGQDISVLLSRELFNEMLKHRNDAACPANGFYTYDAFVAAANSFSGFGTTGDTDTRKREIAAFLAQTSHETTGGWPTAPDGPYSWGYCFKEEQGNPPDYCVANQEWPCVTGKKYYGRGPIQISYNYNYGPAGKAINSDLLGNPDLVATDPTISFKTALWFWMTPQSPKPSCHDVITGRWAPSTADSSAGRVPGYGVITNIINGGIECGKGQNAKVEDRIGFYKRYCDLLQVGYGKNLDCYGQQPFA